MLDVRLTTVSGLARLVATDIFGIHMKPNIHPQYREVAFTDMSIGKTFIIRSTADARDTIEIDGVTYPQVKLDTSSESHPFYTGAQTRIVEAGRVEKFRQKFALSLLPLTLLLKLPRLLRLKIIFQFHTDPKGSLLGCPFFSKITPFRSTTTLLRC